MSEILKYKGLTGTVDYSDHDKCWYGALIGVNGAILYEAEEKSGLQADFEEACESYLETCREYNWPIFREEKAVVPAKPVRESAKVHNTIKPAYV